MTTEVILVLITLMSTFVGTILNPRPWVKGTIIALACFASAATLAKAREDALDKAFTKAALASQLATSIPTPEYQRSLDHGVSRVATKHKLESGSIITKNAAKIYFFDEPGSDHHVGIFVFDQEDSGNAFVKFVSKEPLDHMIESAMFNVPEIRELDSIQRVLNDVAVIGNVVLDDLPWVTTDTKITTTTSLDPSPLNVTVTAQEGTNKVTISMDSSALEPMLRLPPLERNWRAHQAFSQQIAVSRAR
jgi:hypothetical protein